MPKRKRIAKAALVKVAAGAIAGLSKRALMRKYPAVSERVIRLLMQNDFGVEEWRTALIKELQCTAGEALLELRRAIREGRMSANSLPLAIAILIDKAAVVESRAAISSIGIDVLISSFDAVGGKTKEELIAALAPPSPPDAFLLKTGDTTESIPAKT